jgi:hypothetical protein
MNRRELIASLGVAPFFSLEDKPKGAIGLEPSLKFVFTAWVNVEKALLVGQTHRGERRIINITGGKFKGPDLSGEVLSGGADYQIVRTDGAAMLEARYTLKTSDGALIYVNNSGIRRGPAEVLKKVAAGEEVSPAAYYFRTQATFETGSSRYKWLMDSIFVAAGRRNRADVVIDFYELT